ncbi:MAG: hypothetical protein WAO35_24355 [Terriglobia bacterium]
MVTKLSKSIRKAIIYCALGLFAVSMVALAQVPAPEPTQSPAVNPAQDPATNPAQNPATDPAQNPATDPTQAPGASPAQNPATDPGQAPATNPEQAPPAPAPGWHRFSPPPAQAAPPAAPAPQAYPAPLPVPEKITIPAGAFVTVRVDQFLSSDKNKAGDSFSATLSRPLVAAGLVVSQRGETIGGHVIEAKKAGRVKGVSHLQITLSSLTLADGQQIPIQTELTSITGPTSKGRDAGAIVTTTAAGAAIGGAAAWGPGAAMGAGAGLLASTVGVLVTRGRPTIIYPESQLTFRLAKPVTFSTARAPQAFVDARTLNTQRAAQRPPQGPPPPGYVGAPYPPPYYYGPYYPYYWGPGFGFYYGGGFYGRGFYGRGYGFRP